MDLVPGRTCRATPYLYSEKEIAALLTAADTLRTPHRVATYRTLIARLAVTGMRIGEAISLDCGDFDAVNGLLIIRNGKFGKSRALPLHPSTVAALGEYLGRADRPCRPPNTLRSLSLLRALGCYTPMFSRPSINWSAKLASSLGRRRAGQESMTCVTDSPSAPSSTAIAMAATLDPGLRCCRPISAMSILARHTGTSRPLRPPSNWNGGRDQIGIGGRLRWNPHRGPAQQIKHREVGQYSPAQVGQYSLSQPGDLPVSVRRVSTRAWGL